MAFLYEEEGAYTFSLNYLNIVLLLKLFISQCFAYAKAGKRHKTNNSANAYMVIIGVCLMSKHHGRFSLRTLEKFLLRTLRSLPVRSAHAAWMDVIHSTPHIDAMLRSKGDYQTRHLQSYMHRRWSAAQKLDTLRTHVGFMQQNIHSSHHAALYGADDARYGEPAASGEGIVLMQWEMKDTAWQLMLLRAQHNKEGELQLSLQDSEGHEVYLLVFSVGHDPKHPEHLSLYIGCLQGARPENGGTALINAFYKQHHGLRAQGLLMTALYAFAETFGIERIRGIADGHTINSRYRTKIKTSYDTFWQECHAEQQEEGWFLLPEQEEKRDIETVKSKHRSAFRKREAWREEARLNVLAALMGLRSPADSAAEPQVAAMREASVA